MKLLLKVLTDTAGIAKVCGYSVAVRWLAQIVLHFPDVLKSGNLQPADRAMGPGPFAVRRAGSRALLKGPQVFSNIREIWVRDVYLKHDFLSVPRNAVIVDLGANQGVFSILALAQDDSVRVVAVEPSRRLTEALEDSLSANGWLARVTTVRAFVGKFTDTQKAALQQGSDYSDAPTMTEAELIERGHLSQIDLLKCDIEGGEFFMLESGSRLLSMTEQLAIELHNWGGDVHTFLVYLENIGFEIGHLDWSNGSCIALCRRAAPSVSAARSAPALA